MIDKPMWARAWFGLTGLVVLVGLCVQVWDTARLTSGHFASPLTRTLNIFFFQLAAFIFAQLISVGGFYFHLEWGYVMAFGFFIIMMFARPQGLLGSK